VDVALFQPSGSSMFVENTPPPVSSARMATLGTAESIQPDVGRLVCPVATTIGDRVSVTTSKLCVLSLPA
jgi:hypothetical protein